jgi:hypothetical protein
LASQPIADASANGPPVELHEYGTGELADADAVPAAAVPDTAIVTAAATASRNGCASFTITGLLPLDTMSGRWPGSNSIAHQLTNPRSFNAARMATKAQAPEHLIATITGVSPDILHIIGDYQHKQP